MLDFGFKISETLRYVKMGSSMAIVPVICVKCKKEFTFDTEKNQGEAYRSLNPRMIFIDRCKLCGHPNRIEIPSPEG